MHIAAFIPCFIDQFQPRVAEAMVAILRHLGHEVVIPAGQTCCGQPPFNAGYWPEARLIARHFLQVFGGYETIVAPSGSCINMVRNHYPQLFAGEPEEAAALQLAPRAHEFVSFLVDELGVTDLGARFEGTVTVHDSCHALRALGVRDQTRRLLQAVEGLRIVEMKDSNVCCGFGGGFSVRYPETSVALADEKLENALGTGAEYLVGVEGSCLMHLRGRLERLDRPMKTLHVAELLARGMGLL